MIPRTLAMLSLVPAAPTTITAHALAGALATRGHKVTPRTVQRDLVELATFLPLIARTDAKPFGWSWAPGSACVCCGALR